ncbi:hypothetical protein KAI87_06515 [Myxococcota bacterium]|nr:hypothetical protein [Myxococcota bacterium]
MPSQWGESPVIVDGQANEWAEIALYHFEEHDFSFALQNDATNLYIFFSTSSPLDVRRLQRMGMTIWLNEDGLKEKTRGIRFWAGQHSLPGPAAQSTTKTRHPTLEFTGSDKREKDASQVAEVFFQGALSFEIQLPLDEKLGAHEQELTLGLEIPTASGMGQGAGRGKGGKGGMGGGRGGMGGGMGGGRGKGRGGQSGQSSAPPPQNAKPRARPEPQLKTEIVWITVTIPPATL